MRSLFLLAQAMFLLGGSSTFGQTNDASADTNAPPLKSPSGHFVVHSRSQFDNQLLMRWAVQTAARVEQVVGKPVPFENRFIHVVVRASKDVATNAVSVTEGRVGGATIQRLSLADTSDRVLETAQEPLCRLLLSGFLAIRGEEERPTAGPSPSVPRWLSTGISESLYPFLKARNSGQVLVRWRAGQLTTLAGLLKIQAEPGKEPDKAVCGAWMTWILSRSDKADCFQKIVVRINAGEPLSAEWFIPLVPGCKTVVDLNERWDNWILHQRHTVYDPGSVTTAFISQLESELTLYPGESGIPLSTDLTKRIGIHELVAMRNEPWIPQVASDKGMSLRILSAGRGKDLQDVMENYGQFFDALGRKRTPTKTLEDLLSKADAALARLRLVAEAREQKETP